MLYLIVGVILALLIYKLIHYWFTKKISKRHILSVDDIPGPKGIPFLGNVGDFFTSGVQLWNTIRQRGLKYYPIYKLKFFNQNVVSFLDPRDIEMILTDTTCLKGPMYVILKEFLGSGLVVSEGEIWKQRRKKLTKTFHFSFLSTYLSIFNKEIDLFSKQLLSHAKEPIDVLSKVTNLTLKVISESIAGERCKMEESETKNYSKSMHTMTEALMVKGTKPYLKFLYNYSNLRKKELEAIKTVKQFSHNVYEKSLKFPMPQDETNLRLMDILLKNPQLFNVTDIKNEIDTFMFGGHDTVTSTLSFVFLVLANHSKYQDAIRQEMLEVGIENGVASLPQLKQMHLLDRFLKECLRLYPPGTFISRTLTKEMLTKTGYLLPAGTVIMIHIFDIHRNPNLFPDPDKFDADRFLPDNIQKRHPFAYIPFSAGHRNCIAQKFAQLEMKAIVCGVLDKFIMKPVTEIDKVVFRFDHMLKPEDDIKIKFIPR